MNVLLARLNDTIAEVERTGEQRNLQRGTNLFPSVWREDPALRHNVGQLKTIADGLGAQCTKLGLLAVRSPVAEHFESLCNEIIPQIDGYKNQYVNFSRCSVSLPLLLIVSAAVRRFLKRMVELVETVQSGRYTDAPQVTAMVHECAEALAKVPETNKVAYRRSIMERMSSINSVIQEFTKHVDAYRAKQRGEGEDGGAATTQDSNSSSNQQNEEDEDDDMNDDYDDDEEEGEYTAEEVVVAEQCLALMGYARKILKAGLLVSTEVADALHPMSEAPQEGDAPVSVFTSPSQSQEQMECQEWVSEVLRAAEKLEVCVVEVGTELYAPCDNPGDVRRHYNTCAETCAMCVELFTGRGNYVAMLADAGRIAIDNLRAEELAFGVGSLDLGQ